ncbi:MAG: haloacetate dehalogenase [Parasphingorhabdus sp.]|jgi:haloacetate dehalogenase
MSDLFNPTFKSQLITTSGAEIFVRQAGSGPALLLLHGYPQTHAMWHKVAAQLAQNFTVVCPDLRGYGDSSKPQTTLDHEPYSKRAMARDMLEVMQQLGFQNFSVAGHDRGARVTHRLLLDYPDRIDKACVMDIVPTLHMFDTTDQAFATGYYHWFFLIQPDGLPEAMIGANAEYYLRKKMGSWSAENADFDNRAMAEYIRCFSKAETIHATCEDYRAAAGIDLEHDRASRDQLISCPLLVLWGARGFVHRNYDVLDVWRTYATDVRGQTLDCGHYLPEEQPADVTQLLQDFLIND